RGRSLQDRSGGNAGNRLFYRIAKWRFLRPAPPIGPIRRPAPAPGADQSIGGDELRHVVPAVGDLRERLSAEVLFALGDLLAAQRLVEEARAVRLEHPQVEAEKPLPHEMARALAHQLAAHAALLVRLEHIERVDL